MSQQQQRPSTPPGYNQNITTDQRIGQLERSIGYIFTKKALALQALQVTESRQFFLGEWYNLSNNKHLAILGDHLLDLHLCFQWFPTGMSRERYSTRRNHVASNRNLGKVGRQRGLGQLVGGRLDDGQAVGYLSVATTVEAVLGAVYMDAEHEQQGTGMEAVGRVASGLGLNFLG